MDAIGETLKVTDALGLVGDLNLDAEVVNILGENEERQEASPFIFNSK